jgi:hypothetical protein
MATNPFANLGLGYMGAETGMGDKIGEALKTFGTAYFLNASGLQGFMDKKKAEVGGVPKAAVPGAAVPTAAPAGAVPAAAVPAPMGAMVPPGAIPFPVNNPNIQTTNLPPLGTVVPATDEEALEVLRSGMVKQ